jgi:hypothetical protein
VIRDDDDDDDDNNNSNNKIIKRIIYTKSQNCCPVQIIALHTCTDKHPL